MASAGRLCYAPVSAAELKEEMTDDEVRRLVRGLVRSGHMSALEHASFTFAVDGISRACSHQLVRHRVASYSQQSQRYVRFSSDGDFVMPPSIAGIPEAREVFSRPWRTPAARTSVWWSSGGRGAEQRVGLRGRPFRAAQRRRDQDRGHHERPRTAALLLAALLPPGPMGDQPAGLDHAPSGAGGRARCCSRHRPGLHDGRLPRRQDDLRRAVHRGRGPGHGPRSGAERADLA